MPGIFLSYRREDAEAEAGRLYEALKQRLPATTVFRDIDDIPPGVKFADHIRSKVAGSDIFLAVIGPGWESAVDEKKSRRLDSKDDFVRIEIEEAIGRKIPIIPALVRGASMPHADALPLSIRDLSEWQNHELPARLWKESCARLVESIQPLLAKSGSAAPPPGPNKAWAWAISGAALAGIAMAVYFGFVQKREVQPPAPSIASSDPRPKVSSAEVLSLSAQLAKLSVTSTTRAKPR